MDKETKKQLKNTFKALNSLQIEYHKAVLKSNKTFNEWLLFLDKRNKIHILFGN